MTAVIKVKGVVMGRCQQDLSDSLVARFHDDLQWVTMFCTEPALTPAVQAETSKLGHGLALLAIMIKH